MWVHLTKHGSLEWASVASDAQNESGGILCTTPDGLGANDRPRAALRCTDGTAGDCYG